MPIVRNGIPPDFDWSIESIDAYYRKHFKARVRYYVGRSTHYIYMLTFESDEDFVWFRLKF